VFYAKVRALARQSADARDKELQRLLDERSGSVSN